MRGSISKIFFFFHLLHFLSSFAVCVCVRVTHCEHIAEQQLQLYNNKSNINSNRTEGIHATTNNNDNNDKQLDYK